MYFFRISPRFERFSAIYETFRSQNPLSALLAASLRTFSRMMRMPLEAHFLGRIPSAVADRTSIFRLSTAIPGGRRSHARIQSSLDLAFSRIM
ncbi:hypothetical protein RHECNPAF_6420099 [Rhizobium etli CNPAF512]|nr:hypothetical protein RHECNPAF_6420099 [Rhizobium etli CNPAF512]